jgi:hypothetical protein
MTRPHALAVSLMTGAATIAGVVALSRTVALGQQASSPDEVRIEQRAAALDRAEAAIARLDAGAPPAVVAAPAPLPAAQPPAVTVRVADEAIPVAEDDDDDDHETEHASEDHREWDD